MSIACLQSEIDTDEKLALKPNQQLHFHLHSNGCLFMWGAYFRMGAYKCDVVVVIKRVPIFMGCLFCVSAYYPDFYYK